MKVKISNRYHRLIFTSEFRSKTQNCWDPKPVIKNESIPRMQVYGAVLKDALRMVEKYQGDWFVDALIISKLEAKDFIDGWYWYIRPQGIWIAFADPKDWIVKTKPDPMAPNPERESPRSIKDMEEEGRLRISYVAKEFENGSRLYFIQIEELERYKDQGYVVKVWECEVIEDVPKKTNIERMPLNMSAVSKIMLALNEKEVDRTEEMMLLREIYPVEWTYVSAKRKRP